MDSAFQRLTASPSAGASPALVVANGNSNGSVPSQLEPASITLLATVFSEVTGTGAVSFTLLPDAGYANISLIGCLFDSVSLPDGDGAALALHCSGGSASTSLLLQNCTFESNTASGNGGAVFLGASCSSSRMYDCSFLGNEAGLSGGALHSLPGSDGTLEVERSRFIGNMAGTKCLEPDCSAGSILGGALFMAVSTSILDSEFSDNANLMSAGGASEEPLHPRAGKPQAIPGCLTHVSLCTRSWLRKAGNWDPGGRWPAH